MMVPRLPRRAWLGLGVWLLLGAGSAGAFDTEQVGLQALRRERPGLLGTGIPVAQPEGEESLNAWQVNPLVNANPIFSWTSAAGTTNQFPNSLGLSSGHATGVADNFFGQFGRGELGLGGMAPGVSRVDAYEAGYFYGTIVTGNQPIRAQVVNQSFIFFGETPGPIEAVYDAYAVARNVLFVSGMNNAPDTPPAPGTAYNGLGVGIISPTALTSIGPTSDGRAKPDLVAPNSCCSSFSTPLVAGAAALLLQAAGQNDGGSGTAALATNSPVIKALLLNGAVKPTNWTNGVSRPLDARYGAGVLNAYLSDRQLRGGRRIAGFTNNVPLNLSHPPVAVSNLISSARGWDYSSIQSTVQNDRVAHYVFQISTNAAFHSATVTLTWKKGAAALPNLDLFLYNADTSNLVAASTSRVDNVEHLFVRELPPGRYDLQVLKSGGVGAAGGQTYALAFDFTPVRLESVRQGESLLLRWPAGPAGFALETIASLETPRVWQPVPVQPVLSNGFSTVLLPPSPGQNFFRLFRP